MYILTKENIVTKKKNKKKFFFYIYQCRLVPNIMMKKYIDSHRL